MAIFNITNNKLGDGEGIRNFKTDNMNIHIDSMDLKISELQITYQEWLGN